VLQAEVYPSLLIRNRRKFHIRTYVVIIEKLHDDELVDIHIYNRHEVRIAGLPVDEDESDRDRLSHITNGALSDHTERCLIQDVDELVALGVQEKMELFVASTFAKHLLPDIKRRVSLVSKQESTSINKFAVAGLDLMLSESNRIYLLEVNSNPAAPPEAMVTPSFKEHLTGFMHDLIELVVGQPSNNFLSANEILRANGLLDD
jgi:Tubulin-tyrosine ligase family